MGTQKALAAHRYLRQHFRSQGDLSVAGNYAWCCSFALGAGLSELGTFNIFVTLNCHWSFPAMESTFHTVKSLPIYLVGVQTFCKSVRYNSCPVMLWNRVLWDCSLNLRWAFVKPFHFMNTQAFWCCAWWDLFVSGCVVVVHSCYFQLCIFMNMRV